jgi:hypothetical protein
MVGVALPGLILLASQTPTDDAVVLFYHSLAVFVVGFVAEQQMFNTLFTFFERLVNKHPSKIAFLFRATAWQRDDFDIPRWQHFWKMWVHDRMHNSILVGFVFARSFWAFAGNTSHNE